MAAPTQPAVPTQTPPTAAPSGFRPLSLDDFVPLAVAIFGLAGGVFLPHVLHMPAITTSFLLATGAAAVTFRFLGGVQGASFAVGGLKVGGTLGALIGLALIINHSLAPETQPPPAPPAPPLHQAYHVTGTVVDAKGVPVDGLQIGNFLVSPQGTYPNPEGGKFSLVFASGVDFNGKPTFPSLTISDGSLVSNPIPLNPQANSGLEIPLGNIPLHPASSAALAPSPAGSQTAALTPAPEQKQ